MLHKKYAVSYPPLRKIGLLLLCCLFAVACENDIEDVRALTRKKVSVEVAKQVESYLSQDGKTKAKLTAPVMLRYQLDTPKTEFPNSLHVDFFSDSLLVESQLSAKYGNYFENENKVFLRDSVVVFNTKGDTLFCKELYWDQRSQTFYTDKNVIIRKPDQRIYGSGLTADQNFKWFSIKNVRQSYLDIPDSTFLNN